MKINKIITHASLFSGIGGFELAADKMGWHNIFHCEINQFCKMVLKEHYPNAISYDDISTTDFTIHRGTIDILTGGFPCQPFSLAGNRKGTNDERHLWPEMLRAIREIQPRWIVGENVFGLVNWNGGLVFEQVQIDLEAEGYEVQPFILPAASVNAPHRRDRVWFVANSKHNVNMRKPGENECKSKEERLQKRNEIQQSEKSTCVRSKMECIVTHPSSFRRGGIQHPEKETRPQKSNELFRGKYRVPIKKQDVAYTNTTGWEECNATNFANNKRFNSGKNFKNECYWQNFPTQSPVCNGNDGLPTELVRQRIREDSMGYLSEKEIDKIISKAVTAWRKETIKAGGNAIVHQVALQIFKSIEAYEKLSSV